jgi:hypothetical protein
MVARWRNRTVAKGDSQVLPMLGGEVEEKKAGKCDLAASQSGWSSISRSSRSTRFSRRSRVDRVLVFSYFLRRQLTHLRIALAEGSNSRANSPIFRPERANSTIRRRYSGGYG